MSFLLGWNCPDHVSSLSTAVFPVNSTGIILSGNSMALFAEIATAMSQTLVSQVECPICHDRLPHQGFMHAVATQCEMSGKIFDLMQDFAEAVEASSVGPTLEVRRCAGDATSTRLTTSPPQSLVLELQQQLETCRRTRAEFRVADNIKGHLDRWSALLRSEQHLFFTAKGHLQLRRARRSSLDCQKRLLLVEIDKVRVRSEQEFREHRIAVQRLTDRLQALKEEC
ncbi:hypothetical protein C8T65DRAFT_696760 [Cerioporus squamosus]|nr:hypothetical protein C8T65DRAFT_696760 [Cerioporus squamosus]